MIYIDLIGYDWLTANRANTYFQLVFKNMVFGDPQR